jgi:hypothetical protein
MRDRVRARRVPSFSQQLWAALGGMPVGVAERTQRSIVYKAHNVAKWINGKVYITRTARTDSAPQAFTWSRLS